MRMNVMIAKKTNSRKKEAKPTSTTAEQLKTTRMAERNKEAKKGKQKAQRKETKIFPKAKRAKKKPGKKHHGQPGGGVRGMSYFHNFCPQNGRKIEGRDGL